MELKPHTWLDREWNLPPELRARFKLLWCAYPHTVDDVVHEGVGVFVPHEVLDKVAYADEKLRELLVRTKAT